MDKLPPLPPKPKSEPPSSSWLGILFALGGASIVGAILSAVTLFYLVPVFIIGGVIFFVAAFHYFVWGWWMRGLLEQQEQADDDLPRRE